MHDKSRIIEAVTSDQKTAAGCSRSWRGSGTHRRRRWPMRVRRGVTFATPSTGAASSWRKPLRRKKSRWTNCRKNWEYSARKWVCHLFIFQYFLYSCFGYIFLGVKGSLQQQNVRDSSVSIQQMTHVLCVCFRKRRESRGRTRSFRSSRRGQQKRIHWPMESESAVLDSSNTTNVTGLAWLTWAGWLFL